MNLASGSAPKSGKFSDLVLEVTYEYEAIDASVKVNYVNQDGESMHDVVTLEGKFNKTYSSEEKTFKGYKCMGITEDSAPITGVFSDEVQEVTYLYEVIDTVGPTDPEIIVPVDPEIITPVKPGVTAPVLPEVPSEIDNETGKGQLPFTGVDGTKVYAEFMIIIGGLFVCVNIIRKYKKTNS